MLLESSSQITLVSCGWRSENYLNSQVGYKQCYHWTSNFSFKWWRFFNLRSSPEITSVKVTVYKTCCCMALFCGVITFRSLHSPSKQVKLNDSMNWSPHKVHVNSEVKQDHNRSPGMKSLQDVKKEIPSPVSTCSDKGANVIYSWVQ